MPIKAIETLYKGYCFRSRLESRWAVFMDRLGIKWEYEPEGYQTKYGLYLPDFFLPELECFAEVKPSSFTVDQYQKCAALPHPCLLLDQSHPTARPYYLAVHGEQYGTYSSIPGFGWVMLAVSQYKKRLWFLFGETYDDYYNLDEIIAERAAKSARFEYGERVAA